MSIVAKSSRSSTSDGFGGFAVNTAINQSGSVVPTTNFTTTATGKIIFTAGLNGFNNTVWNVTYSFTNGGQACVASQNLTTQVTNTLPIAGLLLTIVLIALVIGILLLILVRRKVGVEFI